MANLNINSGAQGNPLDALLNGRSLYGNLGGLLVSGGAGYTTEGGDTVYGDGFIGPNDSRYQQAMRDLSNRGLTQLRSTNIGGPAGVIDPSKVTYDPQYGLVTSTNNINAPSDDFMAQYAGFIIPALVAAPALLGAAGSSGGAAAACGSGGAAAAGDGAGLLGGAAASAPIDVTTSDLGALGTVGGEGAAATGGGGLLSGLSGLGDSATGLLSTAGSWAMSNPLQALGLLQAGAGLISQHHGTPSSGGGSSKGGGGGSLTPGAGIQQKFYTNPVTQAQLQRYQGGLL